MKLGVRKLAASIFVVLLTAACQSGTKQPAALEPERGEGVVTREQVYTPPPTPSLDALIAGEDVATPSPEDAVYPIENLTTRYTKDIQGQGPLYAILATSEGDIVCRLFEQQVPRTVDNFVGLARGLKAWRDPATGDTVTRPFYDGLTFHRVVEDLLIQSGDPTASGMGDPGFFILDEFADGLEHGVGTLSMAQSRPNGNGSQFFITVKETPQFDGRYPIFGQCENIDVISRIASADTSGSRVQAPKQSIVLETVTFERRP